MKKLIPLTLTVIAALGAVGGASPSVDPGTELVWGQGGPPRYVPARAPQPQPAPRRGFELRWGTGGPPVLVPIAP
jgi:hypothetical protein